MANASSGDSLTYTYTGQNTYTYTYSGLNTYTYSQPGTDAYGFSGFPGNPMLSAGINATRAELTSRIAFDTKKDLVLAALPAQYDPQAVRRYGCQVRSSMALFELMSSLAFEFVDGDATLWAASGRGTAFTLRPLARMSRPGFDYFVNQLNQVDALSARRDERTPEILTQVAPPVAYFASVLNLQADRLRKTSEFLNAVLQGAYAVGMLFKHALAAARPSELSIGVQAMIEVPPHPSLPAGHAIESHFTAAILGRLALAPPASRLDEALRRVAHRISENRVVAGLHYPIDLVAGRLLGDALAGYVLALVGEALRWRGGAFNGKDLADDDGKTDRLSDDAAPVVARLTGAGCSAFDEVLAPQQPSVLAQMWAEAKAEWPAR